MAIVMKELSFWTKGETDIIDITTEIQGELSDAKVKSGIVVLFIPGSTGGLITIEHEPGLISDFKKAMGKLVPQELEYAHNLRWHDGNGHSHIRSSVIGSSLTIPFQNKKLLLGTWQQIALVDFDLHPRSRKLIMQIIGE